MAGALIAWAVAGTGTLMPAFVFRNLAVRRPDLDAGVYACAKAGFGEYLHRPGPRVHRRTRVPDAALPNARDRRCLAAAGVTTAQLGALFAVRDEPGITQQRLARALGLRESAVTALVGRLTAAGLVGKSAYWS